MTILVDTLSDSSLKVLSRLINTTSTDLSGCGYFCQKEFWGRLKFTFKLSGMKKTFRLIIGLYFLFISLPFYFVWLCFPKIIGYDNPMDMAQKGILVFALISSAIIGGLALEGMRKKFKNN